jgi:cell division protein FtsQ
MKKKIIKILIIAVWVILSAGLLVLLGFSIRDHEETICRNYTINIDYGNTDVLVTKNDIYGIVKQSGHILKGQPLKYISAEKIESSIKKQPYVAGANVFITMNGDVEIHVVQRQPILRIFNQAGESFYLDGAGQFLPLNPDFSARVMVANGNIPEPFSKNINYLQDTVREKDSLLCKSIMNNLYTLSLYVMKDDFLKALIQEVYVDRNGEFELIPKIGNHIIIFGTPENMKDKFDRLLLFYKKGLSVTGWQKYNLINIKFKNQVICSKI